MVLDPHWRRRSLYPADPPHWREADWPPHVVSDTLHAFLQYPLATCITPLACGSTSWRLLPGSYCIVRHCRILYKRFFLELLWLLIFLLIVICVGWQEILFQQFLSCLHHKDQREYTSLGCQKIVSVTPSVIQLEYQVYDIASFQRQFIVYLRRVRMYCFAEHFNHMHRWLWRFSLLLLRCRW